MLTLSNLFPILNLLMFARKVTKPNNRVSIRIVKNKREGRKIKQTIVCNMGQFHCDQVLEIEKRMRVAREMIIKIQNEESPCLPGLERNIQELQHKKNKMVSVKGLKEKRRLHKGIDDIFGFTFNQLNLFNSIDRGYKKKEYNDILKQVVLARLSNPCSKRKSQKEISLNKRVHLPLEKIYRMMDKVYDNEDSIKQKLCQKTLTLLDQKVEVAFFDVTTLYFESFHPDTLRASGYSKDSKFKETQIMLSLITGESGLPLGYELFPGNTYEGNTLISAINSLRKNYDIKNTSIIADRAMFTKSNLKTLDERGVCFIVAAKLKTQSKEFKKMIVDDIQNTLKEDRNIKSITKEYSHDGHRLIVHYDYKRAKKDKEDRGHLVDRIKKKMKNEKVNLSDLKN